MLFEEELDVVLQELIAYWDIPGLAAGIVRGSEIVYAKGFGVQSLETQAAVTPESIFCVQSISKCFVATAVMQMVEHGRLELDAPLVRYLPYFQMDDERYRHITVRQALSHTSGMPDIEEIEYVRWMAHREIDDEALERFVRGLRNRRLIANPGERFAYSNIAYNVLGDVLAKVAGCSFEEVMRQQILAPSAMPNSTFLLAEVPTSLLAVPHLRTPEMKVNPIYPYHRADAPASFLHTTVVDMCHWARVALNRGKYLDHQILTPAGYELMWRAVARRGLAPSIYEETGLGWTLGHYKGVKTVGHGGAGFGGTAFLLILPDRHCAAVVMCNEESNAHAAVTRAVADTLLGEKPQVGPVSWMLPISRALAEGGIEAAYDRYAELKAKQDDGQFSFQEYDLISLSIQLFTAGKTDRAIDVLGLNIHVYPESIESHLGLARLYLHKGENGRAKETLLKVLSRQPADANAVALLRMVQNP